MPPKKQPSTTPASGTDPKFSWTPENDRALLILALGRTLSPAEYERFVGALPGSNYQGVRQRITRFRGEQRRVYEEMGWEVEGETGKTAKTGKAMSKAVSEVMGKAMAKEKEKGKTKEKNKRETRTQMETKEKSKSEMETKKRKRAETVEEDGAREGKKGRFAEEDGEGDGDSEGEEDDVI